MVDFILFAARRNCFDILDLVQPQFRRNVDSVLVVAFVCENKALYLFLAVHSPLPFTFVFRVLFWFQRVLDARSFARKLTTAAAAGNCSARLELLAMR